MTLTPETFDKAKFKQQFYPANPFADGIRIEASQVPIKVFKACLQADLTLENLGFAERGMISGTTIFVQVDRGWLAVLLQRKRTIQSYVATAVRGSLNSRANRRKLILEVDDPQLHQDLIEADEALDFVPGVRE